MTQTFVYPKVTEALLQEVVRRILSVGRPEKVVLFGSRARGDARPDSDLDLLIIEETQLSPGKRGARYYDALTGLFPSKDILVYTPEEVASWLKVPEALTTTALREGRTLYERPGFTLEGRVTYMHDRLDLVRGWFLKADSDLAAAEQMLNGPGPYDTVCFHCQQTVEKLLKGLLTFHGQSFPYTHELQDLVGPASRLAAELGDAASSISNLTDYATRLRYAFDFWPERDEAEQALTLAQHVRSTVLSALPPEAQPGADP